MRALRPLTTSYACATCGSVMAPNASHPPSSLAARVSRVRQSGKPALRDRPAPMKRTNEPSTAARAIRSTASLREVATRSVCPRPLQLPVASCERSPADSGAQPSQRSANARSAQPVARSREFVERSTQKAPFSLTTVVAPPLGFALSTAMHTSLHAVRPGQAHGQCR